MISFEDFLDRPEFAHWRQPFSEALAQRTDPKHHGDLNDWLLSLKKLPAITPQSIELDKDCITIGKAQQISQQQQQLVHEGLFELRPWRKGPFRVFDVFIDTEWRSDWKWQRLAPHISSLKNKRVLDIGCGTGYHCWRMLGAGANYVMGVDPSMRFYLQYLAINHYINSQQFDFLPIGIEDMPSDMRFFDSVFSMGVLYHRRQPVEHLKTIYQLLKNGGELILETLIIDNTDSHHSDGIFQPEGRYAQMRNVWSIATPEKILELLKQAGFSNARCFDQNITSTEEQRSTDWMSFHSLAEFLDPKDKSKTIEGYPAPKRGIFIAQK